MTRRKVTLASGITDAHDFMSLYVVAMVLMTDPATRDAFMAHVEKELGEAEAQRAMTDVAHALVALRPLADQIRAATWEKGAEDRWMQN